MVGGRWNLLSPRSGNVKQRACARCMRGVWYAAGPVGVCVGALLRHLLQSWRGPTWAWFRVGQDARLPALVVGKATGGGGGQAGNSEMPFQYMLTQERAGWSVMGKRQCVLRPALSACVVCSGVAMF